MMEMEYNRYIILSGTLRTRQICKIKADKSCYTNNKEREREREREKAIIKK